MELGIFQVLTENLKEITTENYINSINLENLGKNQLILIKEKIINIIIEIILNFMLILPNEFTILLKSNTILIQLANLMLNSDNFGIKYLYPWQRLVVANSKNRNFYNI